VGGKSLAEIGYVFQNVAFVAYMRSV